MRISANAPRNCQWADSSHEGLQRRHRILACGNFDCVAVRERGEEALSLAYVYGRETKWDADIANVLTLDEARRIASNIAKLPTLLG